MTVNAIESSRYDTVNFDKLQEIFYFPGNNQTPQIPLIVIEL